MNQRILDYMIEAEREEYGNLVDYREYWKLSYSDTAAVHINYVLINGLDHEIEMIY